MNNTGLSLGNSPRWNGLRINVVDKNVETINGLNLTLWAASRRNPRAELRGIADGLIGPGAEQDYTRSVRKCLS